jgi:S-DNA-T family DNA segregation ATPase FtsK/SpoIIIE
MSIVLFQRPPRRSGPDMPGGDLSLQQPPELSEAQSGGGRGMMAMKLMSGVMMLTFIGNSHVGMTYATTAMIVMVVMVVGQVASSGADRKQKISGDRRDYMRYLSLTRERVRHCVAQQRDADAWRHRDPTSLWSSAETTRRWERRPSHPDFLELRPCAQ